VEGAAAGGPRIDSVGRAAAGGPRLDSVEGAADGPRLDLCLQR
jgi:hypothetical protein